MGQLDPAALFFALHEVPHQPQRAFRNPHTPLARRPLGVMSISENVAKSPLGAVSPFVAALIQVNGATPRRLECGSG
jgi:hypothetical protein